MSTDSFYPICEPFHKGFIDVSDGFKVYFEESGNPQGTPVLFIHGGPGSGFSSNNRKYFDPEKYRLIMFDQRGCGNSLPLGKLEGNTTDKIILDIDALREFLDIDKWIVYGVSWGSTLALLYAEEYPNHILEVVVRGVFFASYKEMQWYSMPDGVAQFFPEMYEQMIKVVPERQRDSFLSVAKYYQTLLKNDDEAIRRDASYRWVCWQNVMCEIGVNYEILRENAQTEKTANKAMIANHFQMHGFFIKDEQVLKGVDRIKNIPLTIVHGRFDMICPPIYAYNLYKEHGNARLVMVEDSNHVTTPSYELKLINIFDEIGGRL